MLAALVTVLVGGALLYGVDQLEMLVPQAWRWEPAGMSARGARGRVTPLYISGKLASGETYVASSSVTMNARGWFVVTGVDVTATPVVVTLNGVVAQDPAAVLGEIGLDELKSQCVLPLWNMPEAAALVDRAFAAPGTAVALDFSERGWAEWLLIGRAVALCVGAVALFAACVWLCVCVARRFTEWRLRRFNGCSKCGYPIAGLPLNAPCPECGLVTVTGEGELYGGRLEKRVKRLNKGEGGAT